MVKHAPLVLVALLALALAASVVSCVSAQNLVYSVDHEWAQVFINQDGTIDLTYNITVSVSSGYVAWVLCWAAKSRLYSRAGHRPIRKRA